MKKRYKKIYSERFGIPVKELRLLLPKERKIEIEYEGKDNGWANITQEKIDNSKWNK